MAAASELAAGNRNNGGRERYQDDSIDRAKYEELVGAVMNLELAQDPLESMNLSL